MDALCERQFAGEINCVRLPPHVALPDVAAAFPSAAGIFLAAKSAADLGPTGAHVYIGNAAVTAAHAYTCLRLAEVARKYGRAETLPHLGVHRQGPPHIP